MKRASKGLVLLIALCAALPLARGDDPFLGSLSKIATREIRKQLRDKRFPFAQGSLEGTFQAVDPETRLEAEVKEFDLGNDLLNATVMATGRFKVEGRVQPDTPFSALFDVKLTATAAVRFTKDNDTYFVEPEIKDLDIRVAISEIAPADLSGGGELLTSLAMTAFQKNKVKMIAEVNKRLGKRPF